MSRFTKHRKEYRRQQQERLERLEKGCIDIEKSMTNMINIIKHIQKLYPNYEEMSEYERIKIFKKISDEKANII